MTAGSAVWTVFGWLLAAGALGFGAAWLIQSWRMREGIAEGRRLAAGLGNAQLIAGATGQGASHEASVRLRRAVTDQLAEIQLLRQKIEQAADAHTRQIASLDGLHAEQTRELKATQQEQVTRYVESVQKRERELQERHAAALEAQAQTWAEREGQLARQREGDLAALQAAHSAALAAREGAHREELDSRSAAHREELESRSAAHREALERALQEQRAQIEASALSQQADVATLRREYESVMASARETHDAELAALREERDAALAAAGEAHGAELAALRSGHEAALAAASEAHGAELAALRNEREAALAAASQAHGAALDVIRNEHEAARTGQARAEAEALRLETQMQQQIQELLDAQARLEAKHAAALGELQAAHSSALATSAAEQEARLREIARTHQDSEQGELARLRGELQSSQGRVQALEASLAELRFEAAVRERHHADALAAADAATVEVRTRIDQKRLQELEEALDRARRQATEHRVEVAGLKSRIADLEANLAELWRRQNSVEESPAGS